MTNFKTVEAVRERERELHSRKINKKKNKGMKFAFICDKLKDRNKAVTVKVSSKETLACKNKEQLKAILF